MEVHPGDNLESLMAGSGLTATQSTVKATQVNIYASDMAAGKWMWLPPNSSQSDHR